MGETCREFVISSEQMERRLVKLLLDHPMNAVQAPVPPHPLRALLRADVAAADALPALPHGLHARAARRPGAREPAPAERVLSPTGT